MSADKKHILSEIKRLAAANGNVGPGVQLFERETGIKMSDWYPHIWLRWGDALEESGYARNQLQKGMSDEVILQHYIRLVRELNKFPVAGELKRKTASDKSFPSHMVFGRFGGKEKLIEAVVGYCRDHPGFDDVVKLFETNKNYFVTLKNGAKSEELKVATGFVYLMKSGRHFKVGRTKSIGRRESELAIKIPVPPTTLHTIETDDPVGVEAYWHRRFAEKRGEGEWFELSSDDVNAFKRWKRIA